MPFDGKVSDYFETKPAPVYDRDNPPLTMSEAIRMAVADVEAQEQAGIQYDWMDCERCTAGAVVRRMNGAGVNDFGPTWNRVFSALSQLTEPFGLQAGCYLKTTSDAAPELFAHPYWIGEPPLTPYATDPAAFKRDMLALADRLEAEGS